MNTLELSTNVAHDVARRAKGRLVLIGAALLAGVLLSAGATLVGTPAASAFLPDPTGPQWRPLVGFVPDASCGTRCAPVALPVGFLPDPTGPAWMPA